MSGDLGLGIWDWERGLGARTVTEDLWQPAVFPGFAVVEFECAACGHEWSGVAAVGTVGVRCPQCALADEEFVWRGNKVEMPHDGAWLTGQWLGAGTGARGAGTGNRGAGTRQRHGVWARIRAALLCLLGEFE